MIKVSLDLASCPTAVKGLLDGLQQITSPPHGAFSYCETEIKVLTLSKVHTVTSISRGYGRLYQYYYYGMHKENNRQNWNKTKVEEEKDGA